MPVFQSFAHLNQTTKIVLPDALHACTVLECVKDTKIRGQIKKEVEKEVGGRRALCRVERFNIDMLHVRATNEGTCE